MVTFKDRELVIQEHNFRHTDVECLINKENSVTESDRIVKSRSSEVNPYLR